MSFWDGDRNPLNIVFPTLGGSTFWTDLEQSGKYRLQQNNLTSHCRILNEKNFRGAWGQEGAMRAKFMELTLGFQAAKPQYGDIIGVHRAVGIYDHYGIYESDDCVYEYAMDGGDFGLGGVPRIRTTTFADFVNDSGNYFILTFPENHGKPGKISIGYTNSSMHYIPFASDVAGAIKTVLDTLGNFVFPEEYTLYSPEETIQRARSRMGEEQYSLLFNNCEHFAIWCKTGLHESHQVDSLLGTLRQFTEMLTAKF